MSATLISDLSEQINKYWSPKWKEELLETSILANLVSKDYEKEIKQSGDTVYISQMARISGDRKSIGSGHEFFETEKINMSRISLVADQVFSGAFEIDSLASLQSDLDKNESMLKANIMQAMSIKLNTYLYSFVNAAAATGSVTDFNASQLSALRKFAGQKKWSRDKQFYCLTDSSYFSDLMSATTLMSADYVNDKPIVGNSTGMSRYGFNIFEDNSDGLLDVIAAEGGTDTEDVAIAFHPDFLHMAIQQMPEFEIASLTSNKQFGYVLVGKMVGGAVLGHDSADLHQTVFNT